MPQMFLKSLLCSLAVLLITTFADLQDKPKISSKGGDLHLSSGTGGSIVFEQEEKIYFGTHELNLTNTVGSQGPPGQPGVKGDTGDKGVKGDSGTSRDGTSGNKGDTGEPGPAGLPGSKGERGEKGTPGEEGAPGQQGLKGSSGASGTPGSPGPPGPVVKVGHDVFYTESENCNSSVTGVVRYSPSHGLQLCTQVGWRNIALDTSPPHCTDHANVPERNLQAFYEGKPGIMFQFNNNINPMVNPLDYSPNITAEIQPTGSKPVFVDAVMRKAYHFSGNNYVNVTGIPETFWRNSNWSITALVKLGNTYHDIPVLGIGTNPGSVHDELHLGFRGGKSRSFEVLFELNGDNFKFGSSLADGNWHHITWSSQKNKNGNEKRCLQIVEKGLHQCKTDQPRYSGNGALTVGTWANETMANNLLLDHLIISSVPIDYNSKNQQLCYAKLVDKRLP